LHLIKLSGLQLEGPAQTNASVFLQEFAPMPGIRSFLPSGFADFIEFPRKNPDRLRKAGGAATPLRWGLSVIKIEQW
jgi:hypothetical protein